MEIPVQRKVVSIFWEEDIEFRSHTPLKFNIAPEKLPSQKEIYTPVN